MAHFGQTAGQTFPPNYAIYRKDRRTTDYKSKQEEVLIEIRDLRSNCSSIETEFDSITAEVITEAGGIVISCMYNPPLHSRYRGQLSAIRTLLNKTTIIEPQVTPTYNKTSDINFQHTNLENKTLMNEYESTIFEILENLNFLKVFICDNAQNLDVFLENRTTQVENSVINNQLERGLALSDHRTYRTVNPANIRKVPNTPKNRLPTTKRPGKS